MNTQTTKPVIPTPESSLQMSSYKQQSSTMYDLEKQDDQESLDSQFNENSHQPKPMPYFSSDDAADANSVCKIHTSSDGTFIYLGGKKYFRDEFVQAFGGTMTSGLSKPPTRKFGNPAPLGLSAFALTTFVLSLVNTGARGIAHDNIVAGLAMFYGGFIQLCAGMWEMSVENTFGALALSSYGGFWMSFGAISIPFFGISAAYEANPDELNTAIGFYLLGWTIFTFMLILCTMKSTWAFCSLFVFLDVTFLLLTINAFTGNENIKTGGGVLGIITALIAWYNAYAGVANGENAYLTVKPFQLPHKMSTLNDKHE
ncbi:unnamed protein product [Ambrosiozyma monospora]|uniref:Unnamed protein product n=1 Tax=Ambrosiozyma monospora TaxID=43982 RepID=A0ACB5T329_AMBMO|nr:unnamed protein product [Ambrosiozyma monospora]